MDQGRDVETRRLREAMDTTRASIRDTVGQLREKVSEAVDWRHYVTRYPGASLTAAAMLGVLVGHQIGSMMLGNGRSAVRTDDHGFAVPATHAPAGYAGEESRVDRTGRTESSDPFRPLSASWSRAGSRLERILNRLIDEAGETLENAVVPLLIRRVEDWFGVGGAPRHAAGSREPGDPGAPAGTHAYPTETRRGAERS